MFHRVASERPVEAVKATREGVPLPHLPGEGQLMSILGVAYLQPPTGAVTGEGREDAGQEGSDAPKDP